jgi:AmiR/NasT family two-component response regulator
LKNGVREAGKLRVLVAEDDFLVAEMVKGQLQQLGHQVVAVAENGHLAAEKTRDLRPDVIIMDINMPDMDGIDGMRLIQKHFPTPVVIMTAYESEDLLEKATAAGAGAYLVKPSSVAEIDRAITIAVARFSDIMELRKVNGELREALAKVKTLSGLLPVCVHCRKIRDDKGYWSDVETYLAANTGADVSRCLCPDCMKKIYPEF